MNGGVGAIVEGCVIKDCNTALYVNAGTAIGKIISSGCATLAKGGNGATIDKIYSFSTPTTILDFVGTAGRIGCTLNGFKFSLATFTSAAAANNAITLLTLPTKLYGKIEIKITSGTNYIWYNADIFWDGTTLTTSNVMTNFAGVFTFTSLTSSAGNLILNFYSGNALSTVVTQDFDGKFYLAT